MTDDSERRARAGEIVLGLASEAEQARELATDGALRADVERFAARMTALDDTAGMAEVPTGLWDRISSRLDATPQDADAPAAVPVAKPLPVAANRNFGRMLALAATLVAGIGLGYIAGYMTLTRPQPVVVVVLDTAANTPGAVFEAYADNSVRIMLLEDFQVPAGQVMQVWTLYDKAVGPVSLGTLADADPIVLGGKPLPRPATDQLYEITLEQAPGSPTGKPTGPILVKGFAKMPASRAL